MLCCQSIKPWTSAGPVSATNKFEWLLLANLGMPETRAAQREWRNYVRNREVEHVSDPADELNGQLIPDTWNARRTYMDHDHKSLGTTTTGDLRLGQYDSCRDFYTAQGREPGRNSGRSCKSALTSSLK